MAAGYQRFPLRYPTHPSCQALTIFSRPNDSTTKELPFNCYKTRKQLLQSAVKSPSRGLKLATHWTVLNLILSLICPDPRLCHKQQLVEIFKCVISKDYFTAPQQVGPFPIPNRKYETCLISTIQRQVVFNRSLTIVDEKKKTGKHHQSVVTHFLHLLQHLLCQNSTKLFLSFYSLLNTTQARAAS